MAEENKQAPAETLEVELKNPGLAALLAWLWPGAGHLYQGRTAKGALYMICILTTYFFGFYIGDGRVVYASWRPEDRRLPYLCQVGVGIPALPAMLQAKIKEPGKPSPWRTDLMAPPQVAEHWQPGQYMDELAQWHQETGVGFELGTLFTMVAGLLNILAIYDAFAGPVFIKPEDKKDKKKKKQRGPPEDEKKNDAKEEGIEYVEEKIS